MDFDIKELLRRKTIRTFFYFGPLAVFLSFIFNVLHGFEFDIYLIKDFKLWEENIIFLSQTDGLDCLRFDC